MGNAIPVRLSGPGDLVESIPQLLGFVPGDCVVAVMLDRANQLAVTSQSAAPFEPAIYAAQMYKAALRSGAESVYLIGYGTPAQIGACMHRAAVLLGAVLRVSDPLIVLPNGRWRHFDKCACCPPEGSEQTGLSGAALSLRVLTETDPAPSREALDARLAPTARAGRIAAVAAPEQPESDLEMLQAVAAVLLGDEPLDQLPDVILARAARAVGTTRLRDALLTRLCPSLMSLDELGELGPVVCQALPIPWSGQSREGSRRVRDRFVQFCAALPTDRAAWPLAALAAFSWWRGDGAVGMIASDRALAIEPGCSLAVLAQRLLTEAIPPL